jgi:hypothetical protein
MAPLNTGPAQGTRFMPGRPLALLAVAIAVLLPAHAFARWGVGLGFGWAWSPPAYYAPPAYYYPPPYYAPPAYYPPPPAYPPGYGGTCYAGAYVCALPGPGPLGGTCTCPGLGAPSYGRIG